eukprot:10008089-Ditylum_brightwellii.AAC.1
MDVFSVDIESFKDISPEWIYNFDEMGLDATKRVRFKVMSKKSMKKKGDKSKKVKKCMKYRRAYE